MTPEAHFMRFDIDKPMPKEYVGRVPCSSSGHQEVASMVTISDPKNATKVWFGFSDVEWTPATKALHENEGHRKRHMQMLDVKLTLAGTPQPHSQNIAKLGDVVAEYCIDPLHASKVFFDAPFAYRPRKLQLKQVIAKANVLRKDRGVVLALNDPAGITTELAQLMDERLNAFLEKPEYKRELAVSGAIVQMRDAVANQAELAEVRASEELAADAKTGMHETYMPGWMPGQAVRPDPALAKRYRNVTSAHLENVGRNAWKSYLEKYDENARAAWQTDYDKALADFDRDYLAPLAQAHATWMASARSCAYFACNFDAADMQSGVVYIAVFNRSMGGTQDKMVCADLYRKWFDGSPDDKSNLLQRALIFNQDLLADEVKKVADSGVNWKDLPWDKLINAFDTAVARVVAGQPDVLGQLLVRIAGAVTGALNTAVNSPRVHAGLLAVSAAQRTPLVKVEVHGGKKAFRAMVIRELLKLSSQAGKKMQPSQNAMNRAVAAELRRLEILGLNLEGTEKKRFFVLIDPEQAKKSFGRNATAQQIAQGLATSIRDPKKLEALELGRWRQRIDAAGASMGKGVTVSLPFGFNVLTAYVQYHGLSSIIDQDAKALAQSKPELARRMWAQGVQLAGTISELVGRGVGMLDGATLKRGVAVPVRYISRLLANVGRWLGVAGGLVMAGLDFARAESERAEGNNQAAIAYRVMGILGFGATLVLLFSPVIGLVLVGLMIMWSFIMNSMVDNKMHDWLERVHQWGKLKDKRYGTPEEEMNELKLAMES